MNKQSNYRLNRRFDPRKAGLMTDPLELYEANTHVFVVKIWLEEKADEGNQARWRGHVTYLPSGERCYVQDLDEITAFIQPHLERMGVKSSWQARIRKLLKPDKGSKP